MKSVKIIKQYIHYLLIPLFAVIGALIFVNLFARIDFNSEAIQARLSTQTSLKGYTVLQVPPVGTIKARTHKTPLIINISLENIDLDQLKKTLAEGPEQHKIVGKAKEDLIGAIRKFIYLTLGLGFAGGVFGLMIIQRRRIKEFLAGGVIGLATVSILLYGTYVTLDLQKFNNPEYEGMLKAAPWMIGLAQDSLTTVDIWSKQMKGIANNLYGLFQRVESLEAVAAGDGQIKVLHVSDIHNNPAAFAFMDQVVETFGVNFVIDSGDMSDFGTPLEAAFLDRVEELNVPYIFIPGNHETPSIMEELTKISNITVLNGGTKEIHGLKIVGIADPSAMSNDYEVSSDVLINEYGEKLESIIEEYGSNPDIVAVHNPRIASRFWGKVPIVLTGHNHQYKIEVRNNSVLINVGSSGASGIGAFKTKEEIPYSFVLLHFDRDETGMRLKYTDTIRVSNLQSGYSIERKMYPELYGN